MVEPVCPSRELMQAFQCREKEKFVSFAFDEIQIITCSAATYMFNFEMLHIAFSVSMLF